MSIIDKTLISAATSGTHEASQMAARSAALTRNIGLESVGFAVAEIMSMATALGVVAVADRVAPEVVKGATQVMAKQVIEPFLEPIEYTLDKACQLEECKRNPNLTREERAERLAHTLVVFGASWAGSMAAKIGIRRGLNHAFNIPIDAHPDASAWEFWKLSRKEQLIFAADEGVHYGALLMMNTGGAKLTDDVIRSTQSMLQSCGVPKEKAHELAAYTMIWEMPNFLGLLAGLGAIYATHKYPTQLGIKPHA